MANLAPLMSSAKHDWQTPAAFFAHLHTQHHFTVDAAANEANSLLPRWYGPGGEREDALATSWDADERYYCNPIYGREQRFFVDKGHEVMLRGGWAMFLLPARTDTKLFHELIWHLATGKPRPGVAVNFLKGRLTFQGAPAPAPFPSMLVCFDGRGAYVE